MHALYALAVLAAPLSQSTHDVHRVEAYSLSFDFASLPGFTRATEGLGGQLEARWGGELGRSKVSMQLFLLDRGRFDFSEPAEVVELVEHNRASDAGEGARFAFESQRGLSGPFGWAAYGWLGHGFERRGTAAVADLYCLGGLLPDHGYALEVRCEPVLDDAGRAVLEKFFAEAVRWEGEPRVAEWTDAEVEERWQAGAPDRVLEDSQLTVIRTDHYVVLTNVGKGTARGFGEKMDEAFESIRELFPFESVEGQRLLPIFYFVTQDQYFEWCVKNLGWSKEQARRSGGVATGDVYSTYHQATNAPVHPHEATHQIFRNRLFLSGGGSWFQEGVASYVERNPNDLSVVKGLAKRGALVPLRQFFVVPSLLMSSDANRVTGGSEASDNYTQAAAVIEFVRHSKATKDHFHEFIHAVGKVARGDLPAIEAAIQRTLGIDLAEFEEQFLEYWAKRKKPRSK